MFLLPHFSVSSKIHITLPTRFRIIVNTLVAVTAPAVVFLSCYPVAAQSLPSGPPVLISELQTGSLVSANEEFVEIKNIGVDAVDITGWRLEYKSATGLTWSVKVNLEGELYPGGTYLITATGYINNLANATFSAGLAKTGGNIRLTSLLASDKSLLVHDTLAWGNGNAAEGGAAAPYPLEGKSLQRKSNSAGELIDTDNNVNDFGIIDIPTPEAHNVPPLPAVSDILPLDSPSDVTVLDPAPATSPSSIDLQPSVETPVVIDQPVTNDANAEPITPGAVIITELLPNPANPVLDSEGEYLELYNASTEPVQLQGYKLQTGLKSSYSYTFASAIIEPGKYAVFYSKETRLSLSNTSGKARLVSPAGSVVFETAPYGTAKESMAWILADDQWKWTTTATPGSDNVLTEAVQIAKSSETTKDNTKNIAKTPVKITPPKTSTKTAASKLPKVPKTAKATKAVKPAAKPKKITADNKYRKVYTDPAKVDLKSPIHYGVLAVIGIITLLYAAYEYHTDFYNRLFQLRRYIAYRRGRRPMLEGK